MTVMAERTSQMSVEEFETIASTAPETVTLEFINGRIGVKRVADGDHDTIVLWLARRCMRARPDLDLYQGRGLKVERYRKGHARPDAVLAPEAHFAGSGEWADPDGALMAVEVTSYDSDTNKRDRHDKPTAYGASGIPFYLLIDRDNCSITLYSDPAPDGGYRTSVTKSFGLTLSIPDLGIDLDTEELKKYVS